MDISRTSSRLATLFARSLLGCTAAVLCLACAGTAHAVTCTTQSEMKDPARSAIITAARTIAQKSQANDAPGVKASTVPSVAASFGGIANAIQTLSPLITGATLNVTSVYDLNATDAPAGQDEVQFFCGVAANAAHVTFTIPQLPPGHYAFATVEASGVKNPQRLALLLQQAAQPAGSWQLAGFFPRPLLAAGHDGVWYWEKARSYAKASQPWNAYFYFQTAAYLLLPADFVSSANLEKLLQEQSAATPPGLPGAQPMTVSAQGTQFPITDLHTDASFGGLDMVIGYTTGDVSDSAATRTRTVALMKALLIQHPEWKEAFHGLWVFANAPNQHPFALELPMADITAQP